MLPRRAAETNSQSAGGRSSWARPCASSCLAPRSVDEDAANFGGEDLAAKGASYRRRPVSPVIHLHARSFFLTRACRACQLKRRDAGAYSTTAGPCGPRRLRKPPGEPCGLSGTSRSRGLPFGTRVRRFWARPAFRDPPLPCRSTRAGSTWDALFASETVATHDIAAARTTAVGRQGLLDLHPQRASIQAPAAATSGVGSKRPVRAAAGAS